ncbi:hypothetical protein Tco_0112407, partial [Tanacetum coccineum]
LGLKSRMNSNTHSTYSSRLESFFPAQGICHHIYLAWVTLVVSGWYNFSHASSTVLTRTLSLCLAASARTQNLVLMHHNRPQSLRVHRGALTQEHCIVSPLEFGKLHLAYRPHISLVLLSQQGEGLDDLEEILDKPSVVSCQSYK